MFTCLFVSVFVFVLCHVCVFVSVCVYMWRVVVRQHGETALHATIWHGFPILADLLIAAGANTDTVNQVRGQGRSRRTDRSGHSTLTGQVTGTVFQVWGQVGQVEINQNFRAPIQLKFADSAVKDLVILDNKHLIGFHDFTKNKLVRYENSSTSPFLMRKRFNVLFTNGQVISSSHGMETIGNPALTGQQTSLIR